MSSSINGAWLDTQFLFNSFISPWVIYIASALFALYLILEIIRAFITKKPKAVFIVGENAK